VLDYSYPRVAALTAKGSRRRYQEDDELRWGGSSAKTEKVLAHSEEDVIFHCSPKGSRWSCKESFKRDHKEKAVDEKEKERTGDSGEKGR